MKSTTINNSNPLLIIPNITKQKISAANSVQPISAGLIVTIFLLAHRAQISASLPKMEKQSIQQLASAKWNARQFAKAPIVRSTIASIVVAETLMFEQNVWSNMTTDEAQNYAMNIYNDLLTSQITPGCRILPNNVINSNNIKSHRQALMAKYVGIWQATPIYEPNSIIKNITICNLNGNELGKQIISLHQNLQLEIDETFNSIIMDSKNQDSFAEALSACITEYLLSEDEELLFEDAITISSKDNLFPLERLISNVSRPLPIDNSYNEPINEELLSSPLFSYVAAQNESIKPNKKKAKPSPKRKPKAK